MSRRRATQNENVYRADPFSDEELAASFERQSPAEKAARVAEGVDASLKLCRLVPAMVVGPGVVGSGRR